MHSNAELLQVIILKHYVLLNAGAIQTSFGTMLVDSNVCADQTFGAETVDPSVGGCWCSSTMIKTRPKNS